MWRMYLAYCEAGFAERRIGVVQTVLAKPHWRGSVRAASRRRRRRSARSRLPAEHPPRGPVEDDRGAARGELRERGPAARTEDVVAGLDGATIFAAHAAGSTRSQLEVSA